MIFSFPQSLPNSVSSSSLLPFFSSVPASFLLTGVHFFHLSLYTLESHTVLCCVSLSIQLFLSLASNIRYFNSLLFLGRSFLTLMRCLSYGSCPRSLYRSCEPLSLIFLAVFFVSLPRLIYVFCGLVVKAIVFLIYKLEVQVALSQVRTTHPGLRQSCAGERYRHCYGSRCLIQMVFVLSGCGIVCYIWLGVWRFL